MAEFDLDHIAKLARLDLSAEEKALFKEQIGDIIQYVEKLEEVNVEGVEPMSHPHGLEALVREDAEKPCLSTEEALANAPQTAQGQFSVPKVIE